MSSRNTDLRPAGAELGNLLRHWRSVRGRNQLDLSIETGISQRHISFIESGRSKPSRQTLLEIAQVLDVPLRERNALLLSAGFAPVYSEAAWNSAQMHSVTKALERILASTSLSRRRHGSILESVVEATRRTARRKSHQTAQISSFERRFRRLGLLAAING